MPVVSFWHGRPSGPTKIPFRYALAINSSDVHPTGNSSQTANPHRCPFPQYPAKILFAILTRAVASSRSSVRPILDPPRRNLSHQRRRAPHRRRNHPLHQRPIPPRRNQIRNPQPPVTHLLVEATNITRSRSIDHSVGGAASPPSPSRIQFQHPALPFHADHPLLEYVK